VGPIAASPPGQVNEGICRPIFTLFLPGEGFDRIGQADSVSAMSFWPSLWNRIRIG
jgi:hypothetical protein